MRNNGKNILDLGAPNARQTLFFTAEARFVAYGGARGGGKSWAVRKKAALLCLNYPGIRILLVRRTFPELRENHLLPLQRELKQLAVYRETEKAFLFHNGSRLRFGYCAGDSDVTQYQGQEFDVIFIDEATQFSYMQFLALTACLRGANAFPKRMYLTCNPGGVGHDWVKRLFIDRRYQGSEQPQDYVFVPARVYDNEALLSQDPGYVQMLENLPSELRRAWLEGDWDVFEGQYFTSFSRDLHVVEPFPVPGHWRVYRTVDYGLDMLACYWIALDGQRKAYVFRELYESNLIISQAAQKIQRLSGERADVTLLPPDLFNRRQETGRSAADIFAEHGIAGVKTGGSRVDGWLAMLEWLQPRENADGERLPDMRIFSTCSNLIRTLPLLRHDPVNPNDVASEPHELTHGPDAIRGFCIFRAMEAQMRTPEPSVPGTEDFLNYGM